MTLTQMQASEPEIRGILSENFLMRFDLLLRLGHKLLCLDEDHLIEHQIAGDRIRIIPSLDFPDTPEIPQPILVPVRLGEFGSRNIIQGWIQEPPRPSSFQHRLVVTAYTLTTPGVARKSPATRERSPRFSRRRTSALENINTM